MKQAFASIVVLVAVSVAVVSCGSYNAASSSSAHKSGLKFRAFVSNPLFSSGTANFPVLNIVDATHDLLSRSTVSLLGISNQPGLMVVSPNLKYTMVFSPNGNSVATIDNGTESPAAAANGSTNSTLPISLPGSTESLLFGSDSVTGYAAVPTAPVTGQALGTVQVLNLLNSTTTASIPVPGARFIVSSPDGGKILVFSDNSDTVTVINTVLIGTNTDPRSYITTGFDRPVGAIFGSDNNTAYVFDCGPECGGTVAGITTLDVGSLTAGSTIQVSAATTGLISGNTLYVAGTPPHTGCVSGTAATTCGTLNMIDVGSLTVTNPSPIIITDGFHNRMQIGGNNQLFIGARSCTSINVSGGEVRGCLSIFNINKSSVVVPPQIGDVTGVQPISGRNVVYVCQGGVFQVFDTTTDQLLVQTRRIVIVGQSSDVKQVDPPPN